MQTITQFNNEISYSLLSIFFDREFFWHFFILGIIFIFSDRYLDLDSKFTCFICVVFAIMPIFYFSSDVGVFSESNFGALLLGASFSSLVIVARLIFKFRVIIATSISSIKSRKTISIKLKEKAKKLFYDAANNRL